MPDWNKTQTFSQNTMIIFIVQRKVNVIEEAPDSCEAGECHYIPRHPVVKETKDTTDVRIVFDASTTSEGPSLNECLYKGPQLTPIMFDIFLRFLTFSIAMTSDIEKDFFTNFFLNGDRDYLRFLWFDNVFFEGPRLVRNGYAPWWRICTNPFGISLLKVNNMWNMFKVNNKGVKYVQS